MPLEKATRTLLLVAFLWSLVILPLALSQNDADVTRNRNLDAFEQSAGDADVIRDRNSQELLMQAGNADVIRDRNDEFFALAQNNADVIRDRNLRGCELADNDLSVNDSKIIQVVSDPKATVMNKKTAICVTVMSSFIERKWVDLNITYDFGMKSYLEVGPYGNGTPVDPGMNRIYLPGGPVFTQAGMMQQAWMNSNSGDFLIWTHNGTDANIKVKLDPSNKVSETNEANNEKTITQKIVQAHNLSILFVPVNFRNDAAQNLFADVDRLSLISKMDNWVNFVRGVYPTSIVNAYLSWPPNQAPEVPAIPTKEWLYISVIDDLVTNARIWGYDRIIVLVKNLTRFYWGTGLLGRTQVAEAIGMGWTPQTREPVVVDVTLPETWSDWLMAHELGHTFYLWHPWDIGPNRNDSQRFWVERRDYERNVTTMMRYDYGQDVWLDEGRYETDSKETVNIFWQRWNLLDQFRLGSDPEVVIVSGTMYKNGTIESSQPWYRLETTEPPLSPTDNGNYSVVLLDNMSQILGRFFFNASFTYYTDFAGNLMLTEAEEVPFMLDVAFLDGTAVIQIRNSTDQVLLSRIVSQNPPIVNISFPNGGETLAAGATYLVSWNSSDPDGNSMIYSLGYSANGGEDWIPLASDLNTTSFQWNTSYLEPGTNYKLKIIATDGVNVGEDVTDNTFMILDLTPPSIFVVSPENMVYSSNSIPLILEISEEASWVGYSLDGQSNITITSNTSMIVGDGTHDLIVYANDTYGNMGSSETVRFAVQTIVHDISVSNVTLFKTVTGKGYSISGNVAVVNHGTGTESLDLTVYANSTILGTITNVTLSSENSTWIHFDCNTTGFFYGNFTISVLAEQVPGEVYILDNNYTCPIPVHVGVPGDVSGPTQGVYDGTTNMRDINYLILLFNTNPGSPNWKPNADVNSDATVNMRDIQIAILNFNKHE